MNGRIFLKGDPVLDKLFFAIGVVIFLASLVAGFLVSQNAEDLFVPSEAGAPSEAMAAGGGSNATMVTTHTTESQPQPAAL